MHYFQSAPKSPQTGGTGPPRPPHFYINNAKKNNRNPMQSQQAHRQPPTIQNPYAANALPEDNTIEHINDSSGNKATSNLLTLLLIFALLTGLGIGGYFLFRHVKNDKSKSSQKTNTGKIMAQVDKDKTDMSEEAATASYNSYDSQETENHNPAAVLGKNPVLSVYQIYFQNVEDPSEFIGYTPQQNEDVFASLSTLEGIAALFETKPWKKENANSIHRLLLCDYFGTKLTNIGAIEISNAVSLCENEYKLTEYLHQPLKFIVFSSKHPYPRQRGVTLQLHSLLFQAESENIYVLTSDQLHNILRSYASDTRRRLVASHIPSVNQILQNRKRWKSLTANYVGKTYHDLYVVLPHRPVMQTDTVDAQLGAQHIYDQHAPQFNYKLHPYTTLSDKDAENCRSAGELSQFHFDWLDFTLTVQTAPYAVETWRCHYRLSDSRSRNSQRRILGDSGSASKFLSGSGSASKKTSSELASAESSPNQQRDELQTAIDLDEPSRSEPEDKGINIPDLKVIEHDAITNDAAPPIDLPNEEPENYAAHVGEAASAALTPPKEKASIPLDIRWWEKILQDSNTKCIPHTDLLHSRLKRPCRIINKAKQKSFNRPLIPGKYNRYYGCGVEWLEGNEQTLIMQQYVVSVEASEFRGFLQFPENKKIFIDFGNLPWKCRLDERSEFSENDERSESSEDLEEYQRTRRNLMDGKDTSNAWNKDNMLMIIGSTIFFILIGIQSFYWLSQY